MILKHLRKLETVAPLCYCQNVVGWLCWQIQPIVQTKGWRAGVLLNFTVAMVRREVSV